jgi:hypothetical protein
MLPPWFAAPIGSRQVCRTFSLKGVSLSSSLSTHLHLDTDDAQVVPVGHLTVITHAQAFCACPGQDYGVSWDYENVYWRLFSRDGWRTCKLPFAFGLQDSETTQYTTYGAQAQVGSMSMPAPPFLSPIVFNEGERAQIECFNSGVPSRVDFYGWVTGFVMPVVNELPSSLRYFTEQAR